VLWIDIQTVASNILQWKRLIITGYILTYFAAISSLS